MAGHSDGSLGDVYAVGAILPAVVGADALDCAATTLNRPSIGGGPQIVVPRSTIRSAEGRQDAKAALIPGGAEVGGPRP